MDGGGWMHDVTACDFSSETNVSRGQEQPMARRQRGDSRHSAGSGFDLQGRRGRGGEGLLFPV